MIKKPAFNLRTKDSAGFPSRRILFPVIVVVSLALILIALAVLQFRWSGEVSSAEHERMQAGLLASINQFRMHLNSEFQQLGFLYQPDMSVLARRDWKGYAASCSALWNKSNDGLLRNIYLWIAESGGDPQFLKLNRNSSEFEPAPWPHEMMVVQKRYLQSFRDPRRPVFRMRPFAWTVFLQAPVLMHPLSSFPPPSNPPEADSRVPGFLLLELNMETIRNALFPELAVKYFSGPNGFTYQVAVLGGQDRASVLYRSSPDLTAASFALPDAVISLFEVPRARLGPGVPGAEPGREPQGMENAPPPMMRPFDPSPPPQLGGRMRELLLSDSDEPGWDLAVKHREGSLEAAIRASRRRNLAVSFGSLLLLAVSMGLILVSARRAQRLARLQIDFVAGVSHELRTPLAVICSAGDNLAEGVVSDSTSSVRKYGELIRSEGRKLSTMVDRIMQFAGMQGGRYRYRLRPAHMNEIVNAALDQAHPMIMAAGFSVEKELSPDLPPVNADAEALTQAVNNLIQNALKYSGNSRRLSVRTAMSPAKGGPGVNLVIEDGGPGIDGRDLPHIFEPFYRGEAAVAAQIHGTGLGLFMVREIVSSMGGSISAKSVSGKGSVFTIYLPSLASPEDDASKASDWGYSQDGQ